MSVSVSIFFKSQFQCQIQCEYFTRVNFNVNFFKSQFQCQFQRQYFSHVNIYVSFNANNFEESVSMLISFLNEN